VSSARRKIRQKSSQWDESPLAMRLAFIHVYGAGRQLGAEEERKGDR